MCVQDKRKLVLLLYFATFSLLQAQTFFAQTQPTHPGLVLCQERKYAAAILPLENAKKEEFFKNNPNVWNCLSLAYLEKDDLKNAQKNAEKAAKLDPNNAVYHSNLAYIYLSVLKNSKGRDAANRAIKLDPKSKSGYYFRGAANLRDLKFDLAEADARNVIGIDSAYAQGYLLLAEVFVARFGKKVSGGSTIEGETALLKAAMDVLQTGRERCKGHPNHNAVDEEFESIAAIYKYASRDTSRPVTPALPDPDATPLKIIAKPKATFTESARSSGLGGKVNLAVLFGASGKVEFVLLLNRLGKGLDESAVAAARRIQFEPATKNGKPISVVRQVQYIFTLY